MTREEFEAEFNKAMRLKADGSPECAVQVLSALLGEGHHLPAVVGELGGILFYEMGDPLRALPYLRRSVHLSPDSELASLGLFHALLALERTDDAFEEMRRYLKEHTSDAYDEFLRDVNATG